MRMLQGGSAELAVNIQPRTCARYGFQTGTMLSRLKMSRGLNPSEQDRDGADAPLPSGGPGRVDYPDSFRYDIDSFGIQGE